MLRLSLVAFVAAVSLAAELPISGIAHIGFAVSDLEKARSFYTGVLGFEQAFEIKKPDGKIEMAFFKVNDTQYIELSPGLAPEQDDRMTHIAFETPDIEVLRQKLDQAGVKTPPQPGRGRDGNRNFSVRDPDGHRVEFVQYMPGSWHTSARGQHVSARRISTHMLHLGITVANLDAAMKFYRDIFWYQEIWRGGPTDNELRYINMRIPSAAGGDYIEFMLHSERPTRQQLGSMHHLCLEVPDGTIQAAYRTAVERGAPKERSQPRVGRNGRWLMNLFDPDGTRTELMEPHPARK
ncbi:MAG: VOC family protein [Acidobacteria bacterium]|nr:VOC family protein [Acidobacteriota bacterium]